MPDVGASRKRQFAAAEFMGDLMTPQAPKQAKTNPENQCCDIAPALWFRFGKRGCQDLCPFEWCRWAACQAIFGKSPRQIG
jgi:hypothetical protein